jgi:putative ATP-dependent endonuclease of OLD family
MPGDAEAIVLPTVARLMGKDLTKHGVSIVNVGGVGLRRFARIFQREQETKPIAIPVSCITDFDILPDCAPPLLGLLTESGAWPDSKRRKWRAKRDYQTPAALDAERKAKEEKASGQNVKTFVSDEWTLEYNLTLGSFDSASGNFSVGFAELSYIAVALALNDESLNAGTSDREKVVEQAKVEFAKLQNEAQSSDGCTTEEVIASTVYRPLANGRASKQLLRNIFPSCLRTTPKRISGLKQTSKRAFLSIFGKPLSS